MSEVFDPEATWHNLQWARPEDDALIEFRGGGRGYLRDIAPEANAAAIEWRYTGIARQLGFGKPSFPQYGLFVSSMGSAILGR